MAAPTEGDIIHDVIVEVCHDHGISRPRMRAIHDEIPSSWRVEFPRDLREKEPAGTRFICSVKVCQKYNSSDGSPKGGP